MHCNVVYMTGWNGMPLNATRFTILIHQELPSGVGAMRYTSLDAKEGSAVRAENAHSSYRTRFVQVQSWQT